MKRSRNNLFGRFGNGSRGMTAGVLLGVALVAAAAPAASAQTFTGIGFLTGGSWSTPHAMSADGSTVIGRASTPNGEHEFRWTRADGMQDLNALTGRPRLSARGVSADGSVVVGSSSNQAFRWTSAEGIQDLGSLPGGSVSGALGVSADGTVIVGYANSSSGQRGFRWTSATDMQELVVLPGQTWSEADGVSADGLLIAGVSGDHVVRWSAEGIEDLGLPAGIIDVIVMAMSDDGSTIVGYGHNDGSGFMRPVRWTSGSGWEELQQLPNSTGGAVANDVNPNGAVVVGSSSSESDILAVRWLSSAAPSDLNIDLRSDLTGWTLISADAVGSDGLTIAGMGYNASGQMEAWIATLLACTSDFNHDFVVNSQDFFDFLNAYFADGPAADFNADGTVDSSDFFEFLDAFFAGCA